jgi:OFA family oxalate/formate antiporter-like MFS transporter
MSNSNGTTTGSTRYLVLLGAIIVQMILGTVYGYSIFWQPLKGEIFPEVKTTAEIESLRDAGEDTSRFVIAENGKEKSSIQSEQEGYLKYAFAICILSFAGVMVVAGRVQDVKGPRFPAIVGAILMGCGFLTAGLLNNIFIFYLGHAAFFGMVAIILLMIFHALFGKIDKEEMPILQYIPLGILASVIVGGVMMGNLYGDHQTETTKLFMLWGTVGFLAGAGIGFAYVCPLAALTKWFPNNKGLVSGLAVAGFGFGAYLFKGRTIGALGYIETHGITSFFVVHGVVCLVGIIFGAMLLRNPPGVVPAKKFIADTDWQDTLKRPAFYVLWLMFFSGSLAGLMVIGIVKGFAGEQLVAAASAGGKVLEEAAKADWLLKGAKAVGYLAIFNAVGRIIWGFLSDYIGRTAAFVAMFVFQAIMLFILSGLNTEISLAVGASIIGFNFGGNFALFPSATADLFGAKNLGANYGWVFTSYGIAGVVGIAAGNAAKTMTGSYTAAFILAGVLCLVSAALAIALRVTQKRAEAATA